MIATTRLYAIRLLCLLIIAGITFGNLGGVICVGDNGHVKIESTCTPDCNDAEPAPLTGTADDSSEHHDDCVNCSDLPLYSPKWFKRWTATTLTLVASNPLPPVYAISRPILPDNHMLMSKREELPETSSPPSAGLATAILIC